MRSSIQAFLVLAGIVVFFAPPLEAARQVIDLNGQWDLVESGSGTPPTFFDRKVPVPGLVDMATPALTGGFPIDSKRTFWYRRTFTVTGPLPEQAYIKLNKAMYSSKVYLNGVLLGEHLPNFTPGYFNALTNLKGNGAVNELSVRLFSKGDVPAHVPDGRDFEKTTYTPGIYDDVELLLTGAPHIFRIQTAPKLAQSRVDVQIGLRSATGATSNLSMRVLEWATGKVVAEKTIALGVLTAGVEATRLVEIPIPAFKTWSPENPFLYVLEAKTSGDSVKTRFGMRSVTLDTAKNRFVLNGVPYFLRGTNVTIHRFFEDPKRGALPWDKEWTRKLHRKFKQMDWNSVRYCIGFPPDFWYDIADEEGILVQDEYPIWTLDKPGFAYTTAQLKIEYTEWMHERANHPSVYMWDASNETNLPAVAPAIKAVRGLDLSARIWDNGYSNDESDVTEAHPYVFFDSTYKLEKLNYDNGGIWNSDDNNNDRPVVLNEYSWLWLNRDGVPSPLTKSLYNLLVGPDASVAQLRFTFYTYLAALTDFWRIRGQRLAAIMEFCGLGYSKIDGQTSDHFLDIVNLEYIPEFYHYVKDAFAPVSVGINEWTENMSPSQSKTFPVVTWNDLAIDQSGTVTFMILRYQDRQATVYSEVSKPVFIPAFGRDTVTFDMQMPPLEGVFEVDAVLTLDGGKSVISRRFISVGPRVVPGPQHAAAVGIPPALPAGLAKPRGKNARAQGVGNLSKGVMLYGVPAFGLPAKPVNANGRELKALAPTP